MTDIDEPIMDGSDTDIDGSDDESGELDNKAEEESGDEDDWEAMESACLQEEIELPKDHYITETTSQSNLYACQVLGGDSDRYKPMSVDKLKAYQGFCMLIAINHLPATEDYWQGI